MEATAAIQRALGARPRHPSTDDSESTVIEGTARVVDVAPTPIEPLKDAANSARFSAAPSAARVHHQTGRFVTSSYTNHAGTLEYKTYIPARYQGQALPLVVMLHGCKQNPDDFAAGTRMNELAEEQGFVVVYPKQASKSNVSHCWNWFQAKDQQRDQGEPSMIAGITRTVVEEHRLDARRVYVAGLSAGGAMAAIMGTTYPDVYAAVGIHSGLAYASARDVPSAFAAMRGRESKRSKRKHVRETSARSVPTIVFHGDRDTTVHPSNGDLVIAQASPQPSEQKAHANVDAHGAASVENASARGRAYTRTTYRDAAGKPVMEHWLVHGAGHAWSGGSADGSYSDPKGPDASREMLRFFLLHG
ncbi:MAG: hypothetical protein V7640_974 [Betaproteobacteria bacterium]